jgi:deoxyribonuclease V
MTDCSLSWPRDPEAARALQNRLRSQVVREDRLGPVGLIAGADAHYRPISGSTCAAVALLAYPDLTLEATAAARRPTGFPYLSGLLSFREAPALLEALGRLARPPDLLLVDGQGLAHPRRFGLACHIGVLADVPTIGVAKSRLLGRYDDPAPERGSWSPLRHRGELVGAAVTIRRAARPVFVSVGHRVCLATAIDYVLACAPRFRLPEPIRQADRLSRAVFPGLL